MYRQFVVLDVSASQCVCSFGEGRISFTICVGSVVQVTAKGLVVFTLFLLLSFAVCPSNLSVRLGGSHVRFGKD